MLKFIKQEKEVVLQMDRKEVMDGVRAVQRDNNEQPVSEQSAPIASKVMKKIQKQ